MIDTFHPLRETSVFIIIMKLNNNIIIAITAIITIFTIIIVVIITVFVNIVIIIICIVQKFYIKLLYRTIIITKEPLKNHFLNSAGLRG